MKPIPGQTYIGKSGKPREVIAVYPNHDRPHEVDYRTILGTAQRSQTHRCLAWTWRRWALATVEKDEAEQAVERERAPPLLRDMDEGGGAA